MRLLLAAVAALALAASANAAEIHGGASLTARGVTIRDGLAAGGQPGGGILNLVALALVDSVVTANVVGAAGPGFEGGSGGGIFSTDTLSLTGTTVSDNDAGAGGAAAAGGRGGGIFATGTTTIVRSSLLRNGAGHGGDGDVDENGGAGGAGGGLYVAPGGPGATVTNSLFAGNAAGSGADGGNGSGGGPSGDGGNGGNGGALATTVADVNVTFSTFSGNTAGNGGVAGSGAPPGTQGALGEGSAVAGGTETTLTRTIAAGTCVGALVDGGQNLGSGGCPGSAAAPQLSPDGTPFAGSPAIDAASTTGCPRTDLLGTARPQGVRCDIGAIEVRARALTFSRSAFAFPALTAGLRTARLAVTVRNPGRRPPPCRSRSPERRTTASPRRPARPCVVPRLKGKTRKAARRALVRAHCTLGTVTRRGRGRPGRIRSSRPRAGSVLEAGAAVNVVVNRRRARPRR